MSKTFFISILLIILAACGVYYASDFIKSSGAKEMDTGTVEETQEQQSQKDMTIPLSPGLMWGKKVPTTLEPGEGMNISEHALEGASVRSGSTWEVDEISSVTEPFRDFYDEKLSEDGWTLNPALSADGAGSSIWGYERGSEVLFLSYDTNFASTDEGQPVSCPCVISFSIFIGKKI